MKSEIRKAIENYKHKIELQFKTGDMRTVWEWDGIKTMSDVKQNGHNSNRLSPLEMRGRLQRICILSNLFLINTIFFLSLIIL